MSDFRPLQFNENDFRNLLLNRADLEKALGMSINLQKNDGYEYLEDYAMYPEISLHDVVCIFLAIHPSNINAEQHPRYDVIYSAIKANVDKGLIEARQEVNEWGTIFLSHETARAWAKTYGLNWNVPPYKAVVLSDNGNTQEIAELRQQLEQAKAQIAERENQIAELQAKLADSSLASKQPSVVDYDECSIYGHTSEGIKAMFGAIKRYWINCDLSEKDTIANREEIEDWIWKTYPELKSKTKAAAIQKIIRPEEATKLGRKNKGV